MASTADAHLPISSVGDGYKGAGGHLKGYDRGAQW